MASVKALSNGKYRVFVCDGRQSDGRINRFSKVIDAKNENEAKKKAQEIEVDFRRGTLEKVSETPTFEELVCKWRELMEPDIGYKTRERYEGFLKHFMLPSFGRRKVQDIRALDIESYLKRLTRDGVRVDGKSGGYSEKTIQQHFMFIQTLLNDAVRWDFIDYNPCQKVKRPRVHKKEAECYEDEDIQRLLDCLDKEGEDTISHFSRRYNCLSEQEEKRRKQVRIFNDLMHKTYIWVALASACRRSELVGLKVENVDVENCRITIKQTGHYITGKGLYFKSYLKNGSPSRVVDMPEAVMVQLKDYLIRRDELIKLMGWEDSGYVFISLETGTVTTAGGPMMPDVISTWFTRFLEKYDLPKITLHQVRHTSISYLINRGVDIKKVADRAGHQNTRTTEEIYGHVFARTRRATADEYNEMFRGRC